MTRWRYLSFAAVLVLGLTVALASLTMDRLVAREAHTRYVSTRGVDRGKCLDPDNPCRTVQYAVDVSAGYETIKVAGGTYTDVHDRPALPGDPYPPLSGVVRQVVYISEPVTIQGGYPASDFDEPPGPAAHPTILDAGAQGRVFYVVGEITTTLEGLVVTGGRMGDPAVEPGYGGGLYIISATVAISDCTLQDNEAAPLYAEYEFPYPETGGEGGALHAQGADVSILHSRVEGNRAWYGAGLYVHGGTLTLNDNDVVGNVAFAQHTSETSGYGGGLYLTGTRASLLGDAVTGNLSACYGGGLQLVDSRVTLDRVTIAGNSARGLAAGRDYGAGGGLWAASSQVTVTGNTVTGNFAAWYGGGLYLTGSEAVIEQTPVTDNAVDGGRHGLWGGGAALYVVDGHLTLLQDAVQRNSARITPCGALCLSSSTLRAENTFIADNGITWLSTEETGALDLNGSMATVDYVTLTGNRGANRAGIQVSEGSAVTVTNTIVVSHTVGIGVATSSTVTLEATAWGAGEWANDVDWVGEGTIVTGTINVWGDPDFIDPAGGDYHIGPASIARDHGIPSRIHHDIDGERRPDGCFHDIGADEVLTGTLCWPLYLPLVPRPMAERQQCQPEVGCMRTR